MKVDRFKYDLPKELIAQEPLPERDKSRLFLLFKDKNKWDLSKHFNEIVGVLKEDDVLVMNNTRVVNVRLYGKRRTGGKVEIFLLDPFKEQGPYNALIKSSRRIKKNEKIKLESGHTACVLDDCEIGRKVAFYDDIKEVLSRGHVPLPPYIKRPDKDSDKKRYQTVYASQPGATAAPTAGLHFTESLLKRINEKGVKIAYLTLHTGFGTFAPVKAENVEDHKMHKEYYVFDTTAAEKIENARLKGGRVIAVGSTSTRVLESVSDRSGNLKTGRGFTDLFIYPSYEFKVVDGIITNFHLPESTLLMMMCAFAGEELVLNAYKKAVEEKYRFYSYGDAMMII